MHEINLEGLIGEFPLCASPVNEHKYYSTPYVSSLLLNVDPLVTASDITVILSPTQKAQSNEYSNLKNHPTADQIIWHLSLAGYSLPYATVARNMRRRGISLWMNQY